MPCPTPATSRLAALLLLPALPMPAHAADTINWASLTGASTDGAGVTTVTGQITVNGTVVNTVFTGAGLSFAQVNNTGTNYWVDNNGAPNAFVKDGVDYSPTRSDIIALNAGGVKTITFDRTVGNVYLALVSWNGNSGTFDQSYTVFSQGCGYWGCGTFQNVTPFSFTSPNELHGIMQFSGSFDQVSFTDNSENWHGILVGIAGLAPAAPAAPVPEPGSWAMMVAGLGLAGYALRRRPRVRYA